MIDFENYMSPGRRGHLVGIGLDGGVVGIDLLLKVRQDVVPPHFGRI